MNLVGIEFKELTPKDSNSKSVELSGLEHVPKKMFSDTERYSPESK